jgi:hypothetical protein
MSQKQQTFRGVLDSEILNVAYNFLSKVLTVKRKLIDNEELKKKQFGANEYYENFWGVPEETWYDMLQVPDKELLEYVERRIKPIFKHKILGGD